MRRLIGHRGKDLGQSAGRALLADVGRGWPEAREIHGNDAVGVAQRDHLRSPHASVKGKTVDEENNRAIAFDGVTEHARRQDSELATRPLTD
jgi:hypothetical protein